MILMAESSTIFAGDGKRGWRTVKFGDVVRNVNETEQHPLDKGIERYVGLDHMDPESLHIKRWGLIADGTTFTRTFVTGQVLFGKRRAYQRKAAIAEFDGVCSGDILVFEPAGNELITELLPFIVQSDGFLEHALGTSSGSLSPRTRWRDLAEYTFMLPPKDEQHRIAEILWAADDSKVKHLEALTVLQTRLDPLFLACLACHQEHDLHDLESATLTSTKTLADAVTDIIPGRSPECSSQPAGLGSFGVLKVSAVRETGYDENENKMLLNEADFDPNFEVRRGFLLVTRSNASLSGVGRACIVGETRTGLMMSDKTLRLVINEDVARSRFLLQVLRTRGFRRYIESAASGTEAKNISQERLLKAPIPLPALDIQQHVEIVLTRADSAVMTTHQHLQSLRDLKRRLLERYSGGGPHVQ